MVTEVNVECGTVFRKTRLAFESGKDIVIHKGGTGSGKTYDIMIYLLMRYASLNPEQIITVVSESRPHLEIGVIRIMKSLLVKTYMAEITDFNISLSKLTFQNGSILEFFSADRIGKALGARRNMLYGNEINSLKLDIWEELARRSKHVIADFNPTSMFWLEKWLAYQDNYEIIITNYLDNPFLPEHERKKILRQAETDANFKRVHIDCEYGIYEGLVFTNWQQVDEIPEGGSTVFGLDFGYTNDPTALTKVVIKGNDLYIDELVYRTELLNRDIARLMKQHRVDNHEVYADSAEPKSIQEIHLAGFNIKPSIKGQGSVNAGIDKIKSYNMNVTKRSVNIIKELRNYAWVSDKDGNPTNKPIDAFNHCFVSGTKIITESGIKNISDIDSMDHVLTGQGFRRVIKKYHNGLKQVNKYLIQFDMFSLSLHCTPNHLIKTTQGWIQISQLKSGMKIFLSKSLMEKYTGSTQGSDIFQEELSECIQPYGSISMARSLRRMKCIIKTRIHGITGSAISKLKTRLFIRGNMVANVTLKTKIGLLNFIRQALRLQNYGMLPLMALSGIERTVSECGLIENTKHSFVRCAEKNTKQDMPGCQNTVILTVRQKHCVKDEKKNVYDLHIDGVHEYFANGILVHNSIDSIRYAIYRDEPRTTDPQKVKGMFY